MSNPELRITFKKTIPKELKPEFRKMTKTLLSFLLFVLYVPSQALDLNTKWWYDFEGKLGNKEIILSFYLMDNGQLAGNYCYKMFESKIQLTGRISGNNIELTELLNGKPNGYFKGKIFTDNADRFEGNWTNSNGKNTYAFKTTLSSACASDSHNKRYELLIGSDDEAEKFMKQVKTSIINGNKEWIANHISYPIKIKLAKGKTATIKNKKQLIENFDQIFHQQYKGLISASCVCNMFNNYQGVMLGHGIIWINNTPESTSSRYGYVITAINN